MRALSAERPSCYCALGAIGPIWRTDEFATVVFEDAYYWLITQNLTPSPPVRNTLKKCVIHRPPVRRFVVDYLLLSTGCYVESASPKNTFVTHPPLLDHQPLLIPFSSQLAGHSQTFWAMFDLGFLGDTSQDRARDPSITAAHGAFGFPFMKALVDGDVRRLR